jgi:hypothetical protein
MSLELDKAEYLQFKLIIFELHSCVGSIHRLGQVRREGRQLGEGNVCLCVCMRVC